MLEIGRAVKGIQAIKGLCLQCFESNPGELHHTLTLVPLEGLELGLLAAIQKIWLDMLDDAASRDGMRRWYAITRTGGEVEVHYTALDDPLAEFDNKKMLQKPTRESVFRF